MKNHSVPNPAVRRLSLYLRQLEQLAAEGVTKVSSRQFADALQVTSAKVRKDLAYFGQFGRPGVGYRVAPLIKQLRRILGTDKVWNVIVVGAGDLGRALLRYKGFENKGFQVVAAFDVSAAKVGKSVGQVPVHHVDELAKVIRRHDVKLAVVATPPEVAQQVADQLCAAGIMGILNFVPTTLQAPRDVTIRQVDIAAKLEQLAFRVVSS
ncbi:MAG: redox-sensing transcriptional repressor Rex [Planctomycetota bacterium]|nr:redox-sensing transcriptional repressor Rex [Planctomycetota bacterium]